VDPYRILCRTAARLLSGEMKVGTPPQHSEFAPAVSPSHGLRYRLTCSSMTKTVSPSRRGVVAKRPVAGCRPFGTYGKWRNVPSLAKRCIEATLTKPPAGTPHFDVQLFCLMNEACALLNGLLPEFSGPRTRTGELPAYPRHLPSRSSHRANIEMLA
jgi:hypothetical protein